jgi:hypothetical protein
MHDSSGSEPETARSADWPAPLAEADRLDDSDMSESSSVAIPAQWIPAHDFLYAPPPPAPRRRHGVLIATLVVVALVAAGIAIAIVPFGPRTPADLGAAPAAAATTTVPRSPYELATKALADQAAALTRQDHAGWMGAVDPHQPALRKHFEQLYSTFQALHVTHFEYDNSVGGSTREPVQLNTDMVFCLSTSACPAFTSGSDNGPSHIPQKLTLQQAGGRWLITKAAKGAYSSQLQPYPWEAGNLVFAQGSRVTVGAPRSLAGQLKTVLATADKAARTDDRFAALVGNPQLRYRVFLATDKAWKTWYGGNDASYAVAYTIPTGSVSSDVVLHMPKLQGDRAELKVVLQHEMGHVATLSNLASGDDADLWLMEGVADYIGWLPQHTRDDWNFSAVRDALHGSHPPRSIVESPLKNDASDHAVARFYGLGHFAVECLATKYGEAAMMNFVRLKLRAQKDIDDSSRTAFGTPFKTVDKGCITWMKQHS